MEKYKRKLSIETSDIGTIVHIKSPLSTNSVFIQPLQSKSKSETFFPLEIEESHRKVSGSAPQLELDLPYGIKLTIY